MKNLIGWAGVALSIIATCFWAFWGIIETFHEGWYFDSFWKNIGLMFIQYLSPMIILMIVTLVSIRWHIVGAIIFGVVGIGLALFVENYVLTIPFGILAVLYGFGEFKKPKWQYRLIIILPIITLIIFGAEPIYRVSGRVDDGNFGMRTVKGNGVELTWAPEGPGWPKDGCTWFEADSICTYLMEDGITLSSRPEYIWRLPTVEEVVQSLTRHNKNCEGKWSGEGQPSYSIRPDKETPLWNPHSQVIYWWTANEIGKEKAYIIVYDGKIWERYKDFGPNYLGFRAVRDE